MQGSNMLEVCVWPCAYCAKPELVCSIWLACCMHMQLSHAANCRIAAAMTQHHSSNLTCLEHLHTAQIQLQMWSSMGKQYWYDIDCTNPTNITASWKDECDMAAVATTHLDNILVQLTAFLGAWMPEGSTIVDGEEVSFRAPESRVVIHKRHVVHVYRRLFVRPHLKVHCSRL